jgi:pimeloyl-ACP methyl ester carboxylesterase
MTYATTRDSEQMRMLQGAIADFIQRYGSKPASASRRTLFLFPGGMGSELWRATQPFDDTVSGPQTFSYYLSWLTPVTFMGEALNLEMYQDAEGVFRDTDDHIIVAGGPVGVFGVTPYTRFTQWCDLNDLDWFIVGWDWRRRLEESAAFFLNRFLPYFQQEVIAKNCPDPLQDFVLVGHSFGGMIVNLLLRQTNALLANMTRAITVATPFYGYGGHIHRWFEGETYLNHLGTMRVIRVITSMPAGYTLPFLDEATHLAHLAALQGDPNFPLAAYPSRDATNLGQNVDPFNAGANRYPTDTGFLNQELAHALGIRQQLTSALSSAQASKFFNLRGVKAARARTTDKMRWDLLRGPLTPPNSPVADVQPPDVPGDDTQPAWTARLATLASSQVKEVTGDIDHMFIMETDEAHQAIADALP